MSQTHSDQRNPMMPNDKRVRLERTPMGLQPLMELALKANLQCIQVYWTTANNDFPEPRTERPVHVHRDFIAMAFFPLEALGRFLDAIHFDRNPPHQVWEYCDTIAPLGHLWYIQTVPCYFEPKNKVLTNQDNRFGLMVHIRFPKYDQAFVMDQIQKYREAQESTP